MLLPKFQTEGNEYIKKIIHFHCKWKVKHILFDLFCKEHSFGAYFLWTMEEKKMCSWSFVAMLDIYWTLNVLKFAWKRYLLGSRMRPKLLICILNLLLYTFFTQNNKSNTIEIHLDNPSESCLPVQTDHVYIIS